MSNETQNGLTADEWIRVADRMAADCVLDRDTFDTMAFRSVLTILGRCGIWATVSREDCAAIWELARHKSLADERDRAYRMDKARTFFVESMKGRTALPLEQALKEVTDHMRELMSERTKKELDFHPGWDWLDQLLWIAGDHPADEDDEEFDLARAAAYHEQNYKLGVFTEWPEVRAALEVVQQEGVTP